jgi:hypothetical protein
MIITEKSKHHEEPTITIKDAALLPFVLRGLLTNTVRSAHSTKFVTLARRRSAGNDNQFARGSGS